MQPKQKVVAEFGERSGVPHPHEHICEPLEAVPVCFLKCDCGYTGIAHVNTEGKPICPADLARKQAALNEQSGAMNQTVTPTNEDSIQRIVDRAVKQALAQKEAEER